MKTEEQIQAFLKEALKIKPTYPSNGYCGCGEGWQDERCSKMEELLGKDCDGNNYCIYHYIEIK